MHELGIVFHIINSLESVGREKQLTQVANVTLEIGEVSGVVDSYLKLITQEIPAVTYCEDCHQTYGTVEHGKVCPFCLGGNTYLVAGNEFNIKEIEAC